MLRSTAAKRCAAIRVLLQPFTAGATGAALDTYKFGEHLSKVCVEAAAPDAAASLSSDEAARHPDAGHFFGCNWDGLRGFDPAIIDDYFVGLTSGFDIVAVDAAQGKNEQGVLRLKHSRRFLGWNATDAEIEVPFRATLTKSPVSANRFCHVFFASQVVSRLSEAGCPPEVTACLARPEAMAMLVALRRSKVRPEMITHRALASATKKQEKWQSALGVL